MTRLTARQVQTLRKPGRYSDGHGLHLFVQRSGTRSWVQRLTVPGRGRVDRGLGSVDVVTLAQARAWALDNKLAVKRGEDPFAGPQRSTVPTLRKIAGKVADANRARLSPSERTARAATLERHAAELLDLPVDRVGKPEVLRVLERVWTSQPGTGRKLRTALGALFRHARAAGLIEVDPVAAVAGALVPQPAVRQHMRSVPYADAPEAMQRIDTCRATLSAKTCLRFQILTAARPSEARLARWGEIAEDAREWRIPACRMKRNREAQVARRERFNDPLSAASRAGHLLWRGAGWRDRRITLSGRRASPGARSPLTVRVGPCMPRCLLPSPSMIGRPTPAASTLPRTP